MRSSVRFYVVYVVPKLQGQVRSAVV